MQKLLSLVVALGVLSFLFLYQNCGQFKALEPAVTNLSSSSDSSSTAVNTATIPDDLDAKTLFTEPIVLNSVSDCMTNSSYNACLYFKSPVTRKGAALTSISQAGSYRDFAVNLETSTSGVLKNSSFYMGDLDNIQEVNGQYSITPVSATSSTYKFSSLRLQTYAMAFYYLNQLQDYMIQQAGNFFAEDKNLLVLANYEFSDSSDLNAYFYRGSTDDETYILYGVSQSKGVYFALDGDIIAHELGHGNASYASGGNNYDTTDDEDTVDCGDSDLGNICCKTKNGCESAIDEGLADYHASILFPYHTAIGETYANDPAGIPVCSNPLVLRDVEENKDITTATVFATCKDDSQNLKGEVHMMGTLYASLWWTVRKQAEYLYNGSGAKEIDTIFSEHLVSLRGSDNFTSIYAKIVAVANQYYPNKYETLFKKEFTRRGITIN